MISEPVQISAAPDAEVVVIGERVVPVLVKTLGAVHKKHRTFTTLSELCRHLAPVVELKVEVRP